MLSPAGGCWVLMGQRTTPYQYVILSSALPELLANVKPMQVTFGSIGDVLLSLCHFISHSGLLYSSLVEPAICLFSAFPSIFDDAFRLNKRIQDNMSYFVLLSMCNGQTYHKYFRCHSWT